MDFGDITYLFEERILQRGWGYVNNESLKINRLGERQVEAFAFGTEKYLLEIEWDDDFRIKYMECSCPYPMNCKHLAALLLTFEEELFTQENINDAIDKESKLNKILEVQEKEDLIEFLIKMSSTNHELYNSIKLYFSNTEGPQDEHSRDFVKSYLDNFDLEDFGYHDENTSKEIYDYFTSAMENLYDSRQFDKMIVVGAEIIKQIDSELQFAPHYFSTPLENLIHEVHSSILTYIQSKDFNSSMKEILYKEMELLFEKEEFHYENTKDYIIELLVKSVESQEDIDFVLDNLENEIHKSENSYGNYAEVSYVLNHIEMLEKLGKYSYAEEVKEANKDLRAVRQLILDDLTANEEYSKAKELIEEGIEIAEENYEPGVVSRWQEKLYEIAKVQDDTATQVELLKIFVYKGNFRKEYYLEYKQHFTVEEWEKEVNKILLTLEASHRKYGDYLPFVLKQEELTEEIFSYLQEGNKDIYDLVEFEDVLLKHEREKYIRFYIFGIKMYLRNNMGREYYKRAAELIQDMRSFDAGQEARELVEFLLEEYPRRRAMREEILEIND